MARALTHSGLSVLGTSGQRTRSSSYLRSGICSVVVRNSESLIDTFGDTDLRSPHVNGWIATGALIVAEVVGTGVLALGRNFAQLGHVAGVAVLVAGFVANSFTSVMLGEVNAALPSVVTLGDAARELLGPVGGCFGYVTVYVYVFFTMCNYLLVLTTAVQLVSPWTGSLCTPLASLIAAGLVLPGSQLRFLSGLVMLSALSFATICTTVVICLWHLSDGSAACGPKPAEQPGFLEMNAACCGFLFAYSGQSIMLEMQAEMKQPRDFTKAVQLSFMTLFVIYMLVATIAFATCGSATPGDLLEVLPEGGSRQAAGVFMIIHMVVSYTILQQVLTRACCLAVLPSALSDGMLPRLKWFGVSTTLLGLGYFVANSVPLFTDIVNVTGGLLSTQCAFTLPALLHLGLQRKCAGADRSRSTKQLAFTLSSYVALVLGAYFTIFGAGSSIAVLIQHAQDGASTPFQCKTK